MYLFIGIFLAILLIIIIATAVIEMRSSSFRGTSNIVTIIIAGIATVVTVLTIIGVTLISIPRITSSFMPVAHIVMAGKVLDKKTGDWPNNRLVLLFLKGKEVGRALTQLGEFPESNEGIHDGLFVIQVDNSYKLTPDSFKTESQKEDPFLKSRNFYYKWFNELPEGSLNTISVPSKNIKYVLKVLEGDASTFPEPLLVPGSTILKGGNSIVVSLKNANDKLVDNSSNGKVKDVQVKDINYRDNEETIEINKITVPMNNCGGSSSMTQAYTQSQTFIHEYHMEAGGEIGVELALPPGWASLLLSLEAKYGFEQGQIDSRTISTTLNAESRTNQVYTITWSEIWESGEGTILVGTDAVTIPFRVRTNIIHGIDSKRLNCN